MNVGKCADCKKSACSSAAAKAKQFKWTTAEAFSLNEREVKLQRKEAKGGRASDLREKSPQEKICLGKGRSHRLVKCYDSSTNIETAKSTMVFCGS